MRSRRGLSYAALVQLLVLILVVGTIYAASTRLGDQEEFISEAYAANSAMIAEAMLARTDGTISITTAYGTEKVTELDDGSVRVGSTDVPIENGLVKYFYQKADARAVRSTTDGRLQTWLRTGNILTLNPAQITGDNCPAISEQANWESIFAEGENAVSVIDGIYAGIGASPLPNTVDNVNVAELVIRIDTITPNQVIGPQGGKNGRLACLLTSEALLQFNQQLEYVPSDTDEITINLQRSLTGEQVKALFEGATGRLN